MSVKIRMHYDGKTFIPDEPVAVPVNEPLEAELTVVRSTTGRSSEREATWKRLLSLRKAGPIISDEALRRDNIY